MKRVATALLIAVLAGGGLFVAGMLRVRSAPSEITAVVAASASAGATAAASAQAVAVTSASPVPNNATPSPVPYSLTTPLPLPSVEPAPTGPINYLTAARGALVRTWLPAELDDPPMIVLTSAGWRPKTGASPPYEFVIELPALTTITRFGVEADESGVSATPDPSDTSLPYGPTASVHFSVSTQSASAGFVDAATVPLGASGTVEHDATPATPVAARFVRMRIEVPSGVTFETLASIAAYGTQAALPTFTLAGAWYRDDAAVADSPWIDAARGRFLDAPHPVRLWKLRLTNGDLWYAMRHDSVVEVARCDNSGDNKVLPAIDDGSHRLVGRGATTFVALPEGSTVVSSDEGRDFSLFVRVPGPDRCAMAAPNGAGPHRVLVLTKAATYDDTYAPPADPKTYPGYRYTAQFAPFFDPVALRNADTLVFASSCTIGLELLPYQTAAILDFVRAGHKLIIHDSDECRSANYSFLPYPISLSTNGASGKAGDTLELVESDALGTDGSDPKHFIDTAAFIANKDQQLADSDIIYSNDSHWCGHYLNTNALGVSGYVQAYARYGSGLIIYDGLDIDNRAVKQFQQISQYELAIPVTAKLPCSHPLGGFLLEPASTQHEYVPGKDQRIAIDLSAVALLTLSGSIGLTVNGTVRNSLSASEVTLEANRAPFGLSIDVPRTLRGRRTFTVRGNDGAGQTSVECVDLIPGRTSALERTLATSGRITLHSILFDTASAKLRPASYAVLSRIADALGRNPAWRLRIDGYTDDVGGAAYNLALSQNRSASVKIALVKDFHVDTKRLQPAGHGLTRPVAPNGNASGRQLNRRVELVRLQREADKRRIQPEVYRWLRGEA